MRQQGWHVQRRLTYGGHLSWQTSDIKAQPQEGAYEADTCDPQAAAPQSFALQTCLYKQSSDPREVVQAPSDADKQLLYCTI